MAQGNEITLRKYEDFLLGKVAFSIKGPSDIEKEPEGDDADIEEAKAERKRKIAGTCRPGRSRPAHQGP